MRIRTRCPRLFATTEMVFFGFILFVCSTLSGCRTAALTRASEFKTPWGMTFVAGEQEGGSGFFLELKETSTRASGAEPMLLVHRDFPAKHITDFLAKGHDGAFLQAGEFWAALNPAVSRVYFAFKAKGRIRWFGHEIFSGENGQLVLQSSVDEQGTMRRWYLDACDTGVELGGLPYVEKEGWLRQTHTLKFADEEGWKEDLRLRTSFAADVDAHTARDGYRLIIWEGTSFVDNDLWSGPERRYRVRGYLAKREPEGGPFAPTGEIVVCAIERIE